jgi:ABC-type transport system substrate-binding protein
MWLGRFLDSRSSVAGNPARYSEGQADGLIANLETVNKQERDMTLRRLAILATEQRPYVMLYQRLIPIAVDQRLASLRPHPMWPEAWPIDETSLDPFKGVKPPDPPPVPQQPLFQDFDDPVAEPYE